MWKKEKRKDPWPAGKKRGVLASIAGLFLAAFGPALLAAAFSACPLDSGGDDEPPPPPAFTAPPALSLGAGPKPRRRQRVAVLYLDALRPSGGQLRSVLYARSGSRYGGGKSGDQNNRRGQREEPARTNQWNGLQRPGNGEQSGLWKHRFGGTTEGPR
jgi:hypothetical protein